MIKIRVDSYEAGMGEIGGLSTFHNNLYPRLTKWFDIKTFAMRFRDDLPTRENYKGVIIRRPSYELDFDTAYARLFDIFVNYGISTDYLTEYAMHGIEGFFTKFNSLPTPYRMNAEVNLFISNDWFSYLRAALNAWLYPNLAQCIFIHSCEPGRQQGILHANYDGTSEDLYDENDFQINEKDGGFYKGNRIIRDLEFNLTYRVLKKLELSCIVAVSKIHRKEYLLSVKAHGGRIGDIEKKTFAIYHGVDTKFYRRKEPKKKSSSLTIGFLGRCDPVKGIDIIPRTAALLKREIPDVRFEIVTKTDHHNLYYLNLVDQITTLNLEENICFDNTYYVGENKIEKISNWDMILIGSRYEPQGQTDLEAMSCKVIPLVGLGGFREKVYDGYDGVWINPDRPEEIANKIFSLYKGKYEGKYASNLSMDEMANNARDSCEKIWDWEKRAEAHRKLYTYIMDGLITDIEKDLQDLLLPRIEFKK
ncbi:MAG: glycosyltransferase family 4 protein [Promethearchaeota archaeon]